VTGLGIQYRDIRWHHSISSLQILGGTIPFAVVWAVVWALVWALVWAVVWAVVWAESSWFVVVLVVVVVVVREPSRPREFHYATTGSGRLTRKSETSTDSHWST
jgi:hypothetical protein